MRKLLILAGAAVFLAAGCNSQQAINPTPPPAQTPSPSPSTSKSISGAKVDAAVDALNKSMDIESSMNMQSDSDIVSSDAAIINSYNGVSNASSY